MPCSKVQNQLYLTDVWFDFSFFRSSRYPRRDLILDIFSSANELITIIDYDVILLTPIILIVVLSAEKHSDAHTFSESLNNYSAALLLSRWLVSVSCFIFGFCSGLCELP